MPQPTQAKLNLQTKKAILIILDIILIQVVYVMAFAIRFDFEFISGPMFQQYWPVYTQNLVVFTLIKIDTLYILGLYHSLWRYASIEELIKVALTAILANASIIAYLAFTQQMLPRSIHAMALLLDMAFIGGIRFAYRISRTYRDTGRFTLNTRLVSRRRVLIVGAGEAGAMVIKELKNHGYQQGRPVGVIDDDETKIGRNLMGVPVLGRRDNLLRIIKEKRVDEVILAMPSVHRQVIKEVIDQAATAGVKLKTVPGVYELIDGKVSIKEIRDVEIEDLLGRDQVILDLEAIAGYLKGKCVLVTGGGGSIGSELCRQIAIHQPTKLIMLDIYENHLYELQQELKKKHPELPMEVLIGSVRDKDCMKSLFAKEQPQVVFHAAAHKHVPLMEISPAEAIKNNVLGTRNVALCAHESRCDKFVFISTDKAVNPTNIMGASKRLAEMVVQSLDSISQTEFVSVRFGNVLGSSGSVIPLFKKQIEERGPVTVTHEDMTRFFMTIPEAVQLVIQAGAMAKGGEVFVLDMGEPVKIMDLAKNLIRLSGFTPGVDIEIKITGLRPGEKLYEELLIDGNGLAATRHEKIYVEKPPVDAFADINQKVDHLATQLQQLSLEDVKNNMSRLVTTYTPQQTGVSLGVVRLTPDTAKNCMKNVKSPLTQPLNE